MGRKLGITVFVTNPDTSMPEELAAGTEPPDWALEQITNPNVWEDTVEGAGEEIDLESLTKEQLLDVAIERGVEVHKSWAIGRIIKAIEAGPPEGVKVTESDSG
jgi:hypothetical protein